MLNNISSLRMSSTQASDLWVNDTNTSCLDCESSFFGNEATTQILEADKQINETILFLRKHCEPRLTTLMYHDEFEPNISNQTINYFKQICEKYGTLAATQLLVHMYNSNLNNHKILSSILYIVIYFDELFESSGLTLALASISNSSYEIQELSIRVFENYCTIESYKALCSIKKQESWLQSYIDIIKNDFRKRLCQ